MAGTVTEKRDLRLIHPTRAREDRQIVSSEVLGMLLFLGTEIMMFAGLISAYAVVREGIPAEAWPPPGQPRLPVAMTAFNTCLLLASGGAMWFAGRQRAESAAKALPAVFGALGLAVGFLVLQGYEWVSLLSDGLTMRGSPYGSFFYLIVGMHALHAVVAVILLSVGAAKLRADTLSVNGFTALRAYWYFVVGVWPFLYWQVYL